MGDGAVHEKVLGQNGSLQELYLKRAGIMCPLYFLKLEQSGNKMKTALLVAP